MRRLLRPAAALLLLALVAALSVLGWRFLRESGGVASRAREQAGKAAAATNDARAPAVERAPAKPPVAADAPPKTAGDVVVEPVPEHGVPVVVVAQGSGEPQPFALVTRIEWPWDDRADAADHRDVDWLLDHLGRRFRADEHGRLRIPPAAGRLELFARVPGAAGFAALEPGEVKASDEAPPKRIEVRPLATLRVRVVDPDGDPVAGVPLQVVGDGGGQLLPSRLADFESKAPDGLAEVRGASLLIDDAVPSGGLLVSVGLPLRKPAELRLARADLVGTPRTLVLPATGRVELVLQDEHGNVPPIDESRNVILLRGPRRGAMTHEEEGLQIGDLDAEFKAGRALLPFVEVGDWIEADLDFVEHGHGFVQAAGPAVAGATIRIDVPLRPDPHVVLLRGRAVDPEGRPIADRELDGPFLLISTDFSSGGVARARTGTDGSFQLAVGAEFSTNRSTAWDSLRLDLLIEREGEGIEFQRHFELGGDFGRKGGDLGTVVLERAPLLAAGVVVEEDGAPVEHARLQLHRKFEPGPEGLAAPATNSFDSMASDYMVRTAADGTFTLCGDPGPGSYSLELSDERYLSTPWVPIEPGVRDLRIVLARPASLLAHVLLDPGVPRNGVFGSLRIPRDDDEGHDTIDWRAPDERGDLLFERLPPRIASVKIFADCFGSQQLIVEVDGIALRAGERTVDPRLQAVDVRGRLLSTHVVVVDPEGQPVPGVTILSNPEERLTSNASEGRLWFELGAGDVVTAGPRPPVLVLADGFRPQRVQLTPPQTRVTLRRGIEVVAELDPAAPALPESCFYAVSLRPGVFASDIGTEEFHSLAPDRPARFRIEEPGELGLQLWLARYSDRRSLGWEELATARMRVHVEEADDATKLRVTATADDVKAVLAKLGL